MQLDQLLPGLHQYIYTVDLALQTFDYDSTRLLNLQSVITYLTLIGHERLYLPNLGK